MKPRANERNAKLALAFYSECGRGSSARSAVKGEIGKVRTEADMDVVTRMVGDIHDKINAIGHA